MIPREQFSTKVWRKQGHDKILQLFAKGIPLIEGRSWLLSNRVAKSLPPVLDCQYVLFHPDTETFFRLKQPVDGILQWPITSQKSSAAKMIEKERVSKQKN